MRADVVHVFEGVVASQVPMHGLAVGFSGNGESPNEDIVGQRLCSGWDNEQVPVGGSLVHVGNLGCSPTLGEARSSTG